MLTPEKINAMKIISKEYKELTKEPLVNLGITVGLFNEDNMFEWKCTILGPRDTFYKGGLFYLKIIFPDNYPNSKPEILFLTPIYHLNVKYFATGQQPLGHICVNTLNDWKPGDSVKKILPDFSLYYKKIIQEVLMMILLIQEKMNLLIIRLYLKKRPNILQINMQLL